MTETTSTTNGRPLALVTGASSGIGLELAKQFAENGFDLVIAAEDARLDGAAGRLTDYGVRVRAVRADLRDAAGVEEVHRAVKADGRPLAAAALNAGVGQGGAFLDTELTDEFAVIDLNITSTVHLAKLLLRDMAARDEGRLLITSSIASTMPGSFQAVYNASKSFLQSFAQALQNELKDTSLTVTALMPGPTDTDFFRRAGMEDTKVGRQDKDDPAQVARQGFEALMAGKDKIVAGSAKTKAQGLANKVLPDSIKARAHRRMAEPGSGDQG
ncbi:SDR family NAD(P)-dependent oxidoreductase [Kitasatospora terrestris]|uniref:SDR family NAD(P)-dependent oxidoreductase n=1 Tax=Kitasatospora terrestris TaxID=258051 RepID=A0ABP9EN62_9ACTN